MDQRMEEIHLMAAEGALDAREAVQSLRPKFLCKDDLPAQDVRGLRYRGEWMLFSDPICTKWSY